MELFVGSKQEVREAERGITSVQVEHASKSMEIALQHRWYGRVDRFLLPFVLWQSKFDIIRLVESIKYGMGHLLYHW
jgi:hypothetical protein